MRNGSFADFLNELRAFESGVSEERIAASRDQVVELVGEARFSAFEAGELTLTDLQYSSTNFLGFVGYQFGEPILIDTGYYELDATPGVNDFTGTFTGKNGVNSLDDLKTNVQEQVILDEFSLNLTRIENGLANSGQSLDDFIGETFTFTDVDGSTVQVELSLTGILAAAHLRGAFGTLNLLQNGDASADEIGTSILQFAEQFGGFDAPTVDDLIEGRVEPLETDSRLRLDQEVETPGIPDIPDNPDEPVDVGAETPPPAQPPAEPAPQPPVIDISGLGVPDAPAGSPTGPAAVQQRVFDPIAFSFTVTGTNGVDGSAYGERGDDIVFAFDGDDDSVGFSGDDYLNGGAGNDTLWGISGNNALIGETGNDTLIGGSDNDVLVGGRDNDTIRTGTGQDRLVFSPGDGIDVVKDFDVANDTLDFTEFGNNPAVSLTSQGRNTVLNVGDVTVTLEGVAAGTLGAGNFLGASFNDGAAPGNPVPPPQQQPSPPPQPEPEPPQQQPAPPQPDPVPPTPAPAPQPPQPGANIDGLGIPELPDGAPDAASPVFLRTFDASSFSFTVTGTDGIDSSAYGENGDDIIRTFGGNDSSLGFAGNDFLELGDGEDRGWGLEGDDILLGGNGNDVLNGDEGDALGTGVISGSDVLIGGRGDDILRGDTIDTTVASDRFVFAAGDGNDTIRDFQVELDVLDFAEFANGASVGLNQQGNNTVVSVGDVTVTLEGVAVGELRVGNFVGIDAPQSVEGAAASFDPGVDDGQAFASLVPEDGLVS